MTTEQNESPPSDPFHSILSDDGLPGPLACRATAMIVLCRFATMTPSLLAQIIHRETAADQLADALLDMHRYGQTDLVYLQSPAAAKTHKALLTAGYLTQDGHLTELAKAREQQ